MKEVVLNMFNVSDLINISVSVDSNLIYVESDLKDPSCCPRCGGSKLHRKTKNHRILHLPPVGEKKAKLQVNVQKRACSSCQHTWWPKLPFTQGKERMTDSFVNYALELLRFGTIKDVACHLGVSWDVPKSIHKKHLGKVYQEIGLAKVEYVSIDEFAIAKRHKYMTVVVDIATGRIIHSVEGRKKADIAPFLQELKKKHPNLKLFV